MITKSVIKDRALWAQVDAWNALTKREQEQVLLIKDGKFPVQHAYTACVEFLSKFGQEKFWKEVVF